MTEPPGVVLFGGAFNPPHLTHRKILAAAIETLPVRRGIVLPAGRHPHKLDAGLAPDDARLELCRLAFGDLPGIEVSDLDLRRTGVAYTVDTLALLREQLAGQRLFWIIGSDNLRILDTWHRHHELLRLATLVTWPRHGHPTCREDLAGQDLTANEIDALLEWVLDVPADRVSATDVRAVLRAGQQPAALDPRVAAKIASLGLYTA